jgi:hypothetical protein
MDGLILTPSAGWKIDVGRPGNWVIQPAVGGIFVIGKRSGTITKNGKDYILDEAGFGYDFVWTARFGIGRVL